MAVHLRLKGVVPTVKRPPVGGMGAEDIGRSTLRPLYVGRKGRRGW